jgi:hypothetical protein
MEQSGMEMESEEDLSSRKWNVKWKGERERSGYPSRLSVNGVGRDRVASSASRRSNKPVKLHRYVVIGSDRQDRLRRGQLNLQESGVGSVD